MVIDFDDQIANTMLDVMAGVGKRMVEPRSKTGNSGADPIVLAYAIRFGACVLTSETSDKKRKWVKIPDACEERGVPCLNIVSFFRAEGHRL